MADIFVAIETGADVTQLAFPLFAIHLSCYGTQTSFLFHKELHFKN